MVKSLVQGTGCLKVHSDSYLVLKKVALLPPIHMLQLMTNIFILSGEPVSVGACVLCMCVCVCVREGRERASTSVF